MPGDAISVPVYIRRLRKKIEANPSEPQYIQTVRQVGYRVMRGEGTGCPLRQPFVVPAASWASTCRQKLQVVTCCPARSYVRRANSQKPLFS